MVNTWIPFVQELEERIPGFVYYELPTIYEMPTISRTFINEGMRVGIADRDGEAAARVAQAIEQAGGSALALTVDVLVHRRHEEYEVTVPEPAAVKKL